MASNDSERYRWQQEEFGSHYGGSSANEVYYAILPSVCGIFLTATTLGLLPPGTNRNVRTFVEFCLTIVPCVFCFMILSDYLIELSLVMFTTAILSGFVTIVEGALVRDIHLDLFEIEPATTSNRPFVTNFRALTNIITAICIFAVDFQIFPRKYAKTEDYGFSLMDTGVGLFVMANALVAPEARDFSERPGESLGTIVLKNLKACVRNCTPLLILGFGRIFAIEYLGYQKQLTEYGVHWNFFITIAFVKIFSSTLAFAVNSTYSFLPGIWILVMHEYALNTTGLKEWVLGDAPRNDFVSANREDLVSIPGHLGIYLIGTAIGKVIHSTYGNMQRRSKFLRERQPVNLILFGGETPFAYNETMVLFFKLLVITVPIWGASSYCEKYYPASRRLTNIGYCVWILSLTCSLLILLLLAEIYVDILVEAKNGAIEYARRKMKATRGRGTKKEHVGFKYDKISDGAMLIPRAPEIFEAVNYNGLSFFLLANAFTGIVNISVKTLYVERFQVLQIMIGYIALCHFIVVVLYRYKVQIKL